MTDDKGNPLAVGDTVMVTHVNTDRGAQLWMHQGTVVGFGRTRVKVAFPTRGDPQAVGNECLRIVPAEKVIGPYSLVQHNDGSGRSVIGVARGSMTEDLAAESTHLRAENYALVERIGRAIQALERSADRDEVIALLMPLENDDVTRRSAAMTAAELRAMGNVLNAIADDIKADYPIEANSLRNIATRLLATADNGG